MKKIPLTQGQYAAVSDEDFADLMQFKWQAHWSQSSKGFYARRNIRLPNGARTTELMHRRILGLQYLDKREVDHRNHITWDNQRPNLRIVNRRVNCANQRNQSQFGAGIRLNKNCKSQRFEVYAKFNGVQKHIGMFSSLEEAQQEREKWLQRRN